MPYEDMAGGNRNTAVQVGDGSDPKISRDGSRDRDQDGQQREQRLLLSASRLAGNR